MSSVDEKPSTNIPIIDFLTWTSPSKVSSEGRLQTARELVQACHSYGFVYIKNHGIAPELVKQAFEMSQKFFDLPIKKRKLVANANTGAFRGYIWPGMMDVGAISDEGRKGQDREGKVVDLNESYDLGSDSNLDEVNVWPPPDMIPEFRTLTTKFYWECWRTSEAVLRALALGLGLPNEDYLFKFHTGHENELSLRHYPPLKASLLEKQEMRRLASHTDFDSFTLLFQDDCGGLEVEKKGSPGMYLPVDPIEGAVVMNIGDALMRWSNDYLISTKHRVHLPPLQDRYTGDERMTRQRYSIPYFVAPKMNSILECLPGCSSKDSPPKYEPMVYEEWFRHQIAALFG